MLLSVHYILAGNFVSYIKNAVIVYINYTPNHPNVHFCNFLRQSLAVLNFLKFFKDVPKIFRK